MGYTVITIPPEVRARYRSQEALGKLGTALTRMLQRHGFTRGLRRWHFFGESGPPYHPHLNVLSDRGWLEPKEIERLRMSIGRILGVRTARVNLYHEYSDEVPRMLHWVKYTLRPTFLDWRWDAKLAGELYGFRNSSWWGSWRGDPVWEIGEAGGEITRDMVMIEAGYCPRDGSKIEWSSEVLRTSKIGPMSGWELLGEGYWTADKGGAP